MSTDLFTCTSDEISWDAVRAFVVTAIEERLQAESLVLEFKKQNDLGNIAKAIAALANTDGGIVIVGIDESLQDPFVGLPKSRVDGIVNSLRARIPDAMPEVVPIAHPGVEDAILLILRVDAESVVHPVVLDGKVYKRIPGNSIGARRDEIVELCNRPSSLSTRSLVSAHSGLLGMHIWEDEADAGSLSEIRAQARFVLPRRLESRGYLGSSAIGAAEAALRGSAVPEHILAQHSMRRDHGYSWWERTGSGAVLVDFAAERSTSGATWRPSVDAMARIFLKGRILEVSLAVRLVPHNRSPERPISRVGEVYDVLLATCWVAASAGQACVQALGVDGALQIPAFVASTRNVFGWTEVSLGQQRTDPGIGRNAEGWEFPGRVPESASIAGLDALVKEWLHVPLFEFGMIDFEEELSKLEPSRWVADIDQ